MAVFFDHRNRLASGLPPEAVLTWEIRGVGVRLTGEKEGAAAASSKFGTRQVG